MSYESNFGSIRVRQPAPQAPQPGEEGAPRDQFGGYGSVQPSGYTWGPQAGQRFVNENPTDPTTGLPSGPGAYGLIPHNVALQYQATHDRKIWELRQRMMRGGLNYGKGALGLLQSFRQGGGAAIESGIYQGLMGAKFQQAGMTEPLDLLGDYRREQESRARMRANRAAERQLAVQTVGTIGAIAAGFATGGAGFAFLPALTAGINAYGQRQQQPRQAPTSTTGPHGPQGLPQRPGFQPPGEFPAPPSGPQPSNIGPNIQGPAAPGMGAGGAAQSTLQPDLPQGGASSPGGQDSPGGQQQAGQPAGGVGGVGMGSPAVGADGNFMPVAYAANGAMSAQSNPLQGVVMMKQLADSIEADPFFPAFSAMVNARLAERMGV